MGKKHKGSKSTAHPPAQSDWDAISLEDSLMDFTGEEKRSKKKGGDSRESAGGPSMEEILASLEDILDADDEDEIFRPMSGMDEEEEEEQPPRPPVSRDLGMTAALEGLDAVLEELPEDLDQEPVAGAEEWEEEALEQDEDDEPLDLTGAELSELPTDEALAGLEDEEEVVDLTGSEVESDEYSALLENESDLLELAGREFDTPTPSREKRGKAHPLVPLSPELEEDEEEVVLDLTGAEADQGEEEPLELSESVEDGEELLELSASVEDGEVGEELLELSENEVEEAVGEEPLELSASDEEETAGEEPLELSEGEDEAVAGGEFLEPVDDDDDEEPRMVVSDEEFDPDQGPLDLVEMLNGVTEALGSLLDDGKQELDELMRQVVTPAALEVVPNPREEGLPEEFAVAEPEEAPLLDEEELAAALEDEAGMAEPSLLEAGRATVADEYEALLDELDSDSADGVGETGLDEGEPALVDEGGYEGEEAEEVHSEPLTAEDWEELAARIAPEGPVVSGRAGVDPDCAGLDPDCVGVVEDEVEEPELMTLAGDADFAPTMFAAPLPPTGGSGGVVSTEGGVAAHWSAEFTPLELQRDYSDVILPLTREVVAELLNQELSGLLATVIRDELERFRRGG